MSHSVIQNAVAVGDVNSGRLLRRIEELGQIGRVASTGGVSRPGFSPADRQGRAYLMNEARSAGLRTSVDAAGNILIQAGPPSDRPVLMMGSHLDTVANGGRLDGAYGVLAALEVVQVWAESGMSSGRCDPVAVAFTNEEGALFPQPFFGSSVLAGRLAQLSREPLDHHGQSLRGPLAQAGGNLDALGSAVWPAGSVAAYLELHVEQGPVLERAGVQVGVVEGITGRCVLTIEARGTAGHAGTTPMLGRQDAMIAAARVVVAVESLARHRDLCRVATVGRLDIQPNSPNTIADVVRLTADLRDTDVTRMQAAEAALSNQLRAIAGATLTEIEIVGRMQSDPVATDLELRGAIEQSSREIGVPFLTLPSGAGHDAQVVADIAPVAMIFVPSIDGISHVPEEDSTPEDLVLGARVLLRSAQNVAQVRVPAQPR